MMNQCEMVTSLNYHTHVYDHKESKSRSFLKVHPACQQPVSVSIVQFTGGGGGGIETNHGDNT